MNQVVARFADGRVVKGTSLDVDASRPLCHVRTKDQRMVEVVMATLKALFFVKSLEGNSAHQETSAPKEGDVRLRGTTMVEIEFKDGERLVALSNSYPPKGEFFFVLPVDTGSNNIRILVNRGQVKHVTAVSKT
jgi:hypothetical protein